MLTNSLHSCLAVALLAPVTIAQFSPAPVAPFQYRGSPIVVPASYGKRSGYVLGGDSIAGVIEDSTKRQVPFYWRQATGFVDFSKVVDAALPAPFSRILLLDINDNAVCCGRVYYTDPGTQKQLGLAFRFDTKSAQLTLHGIGAARQINKRGDILVGSREKPGLWLLRGGQWLRYQYLDQYGGVHMTLLDNGDLVGLDSKNTGIYRWAPGGGRVSITPAGVSTSYQMWIAANNQGQLLVGAYGSMSTLYDRHGKRVWSHPRMQNRIGDDATLWTLGGFASFKPQFAWNGELVTPEACIADPKAETSEVDVIDAKGNYAAISQTASGPHRYDGKAVRGVYFKRQTTVAPGISGSPKAAAHGVDSSTSLQATRDTGSRRMSRLGIVLAR